MDLVVAGLVGLLFGTLMLATVVPLALVFGMWWILRRVGRWMWHRQDAVMLAVVLALAGVAWSFPAWGDDSVPSLVELRIDGAVGEADVLAVRNAIAEAAEKKSSVVIRISSPGGPASAGLRVAQQILRSPVRVTCIAEQAMSAAAMILEACQERSAEPWAVIMFHEANSSATGRAVDFEREAAGTRAITRASAEVIAPRLGMSVDAYLTQIAPGDWTLGSTEALRVGAIDRIEAR